MEMSLADDDGPGCAQLFYKPGVAGGNAIQIAIEMDTARSGRAGQVEAILDRNGQTPERRTAIAKRTGAPVLHCPRHSFCTRCLRTCPRRILPNVGVVAGILIRVGKRRLG